MNLVFYLGHPAHFHLFKHVVDELSGRHRVRVLYRSKDVLEDLVQGTTWRRENVLPGGRGDGTAAIAWALAKREARLLRNCLAERPDVLVGCSPELAHVGWLLRIPSIITVEDDYRVIPRFARMTYPFCTAILAPEGCDVGGYRSKTRSYRGYHELAYLHPARFTPAAEKVAHLGGERGAFSIVRLSRLAAHHDTAIRGLDDADVDAVVATLSPFGNVWISAERPLPERFAHLLLPTAAADVHHVLAFARLLVSDSQSMTMEAAVLGTPSVRCSDFVGRISVVEELETKYRLTLGVRPGDRRALLTTVERLLGEAAGVAEWGARRDRMLADKIDVTAYLVDVLENLPASLDAAPQGSPAPSRQRP